MADLLLNKEYQIWIIYFLGVLSTNIEMIGGLLGSLKKGFEFLSHFPTQCTKDSESILFQHDHRGKSSGGLFSPVGIKQVGSTTRAEARHLNILFFKTGFEELPST